MLENNSATNGNASSKGCKAAKNIKSTEKAENI